MRDEEDVEDDRPKAPPRTGIPAALMPGRKPAGGGPAQLPMPDFGTGFAPSGTLSDELDGGKA